MTVREDDGMEGLADVAVVDVPGCGDVARRDPCFRTSWDPFREKQDGGSTSSSSSSSIDSALTFSVSVPLRLQSPVAGGSRPIKGGSWRMVVGGRRVSMMRAKHGEIGATDGDGDGESDAIDPLGNGGAVSCRHPQGTSSSKLQERHQQEEGWGIEPRTATCEAKECTFHSLLLHARREAGGAGDLGW